MLKKMFIAAMVCFSIGSTAYADCVSNSMVTINIDSNSVCTLDLVSEVTNTAGTQATLFVASYCEGSLVKVQSYAVNGNMTVKDKLERIKIGEQTITPDSVKAYIWQKDSVKPLSETENVFSEDKLKKANQTLLNNLDVLVLGIENEKKWAEGPEEDIVAVFKSCALKIKQINGSYLLTPEFVRSYYAQEIDEVKKSYESLNTQEKKNFQGRLLNLKISGRSDIINETAYIIDYFDLKKLML